jgi:hypothetical protein
MGRSATRVSAFARMRSNSIMTGLDRTRARFSTFGTERLLKPRLPCLRHTCYSPRRVLHQFDRRKSRLDHRQRYAAPRSG